MITQSKIVVLSTKVVFYLVVCYWFQIVLVICLTQIKYIFPTFIIIFDCKMSSVST